ncbi:MAG: molybdate ABC transporter permease subunit [Deltaproteobacteria bacterium]|nr:molybdate ABC transporter permease subunit [Deltaproteobacteria bacterium]
MDLDPLVLSFSVAALATALAVVVGVALGALLARPFPGRDLLDALVTAPMVLPPTVLGYYLLVALGRDSAIGRAWESVFGTSIVFSFTGLVVAAFVAALPFVVKASRAAIEDVDRRLVDAARTLGASRRRAFFTVVLPLAQRGIGAGVSLGFARALGDFGVTLMIAGNIPDETRTGALAIYDLVLGGKQAEADGLVALMTACAVAALVLANKLVRRRERRA